MTINNKIISIDLNEDEGELLVIDLDDTTGLRRARASFSDVDRRIHPSPLAKLLSVTDGSHRKKRAPDQPRLGARVLLTEFGFGSDMVASARRFGRVKPEASCLCCSSRTPLTRGFATTSLSRIQDPQRDWIPPSIEISASGL